MKHERGMVGLWGVRIPLYWSVMTKTLYNLRLLGDRPMTGRAFEAFMDGYGASMDMFPVCQYSSKSRSAEKIWADFVRVAHDANKGMENAMPLVSKANLPTRHEKPGENAVPLRKARA